MVKVKVIQKLEQLASINAINQNVIREAQGISRLVSLLITQSPNVNQIEMLLGLYGN